MGVRLRPGAVNERVEVLAQATWRMLGRARVGAVVRVGAVAGVGAVVRVGAVAGVGAVM